MNTDWYDKWSSDAAKADEVIKQLSNKLTGRRVFGKSLSQRHDAVARGDAACLIKAQHPHSHY